MTDEREERIFWVSHEKIDEAFFEKICPSGVVIISHIYTNDSVYTARHMHVLGSCVFWLQVVRVTTMLVPSQKMP